MFTTVVLMMVAVSDVSMATESGNSVSSRQVNAANTRVGPIVLPTGYGQSTSCHNNHRLNGSSSPVLTATSLSYGKAKNSTPTFIIQQHIDTQSV